MGALEPGKKTDMFWNQECKRSTETLLQEGLNQTYSPDVSFISTSQAA